jgi:hypothetical protein
VSAQVHQPCDHVVKLRLDTSAIDGLFETALNFPLQVVDGALDLPDELFAIDLTTVPQPQVKWSFVFSHQGSSRFSRHMSGGNWNGGILVHESAPAGVSNSSMTEAGGANNPAGGGSALAPQVLP